MKEQPSSTITFKPKLSTTPSNCHVWSGICEQTGWRNVRLLNMDSCLKIKVSEHYRDAVQNVWKLSDLCSCTVTSASVVSFESGDLFVSLRLDNCSFHRQYYTYRAWYCIPRVLYCIYRVWYNCTVNKVSTATLPDTIVAEREHLIPTTINDSPKWETCGTYFNL